VHAALLASVPLGVLAGFAAAGLERAVFAVEDVSSAWVGNDYLRHAGGMLLVGLMLYAFIERAGAYYVAGVGYPEIQAIASGVLSDPGFLLLLFAAKLAATSLALGTGASGGVFAPSLFLGAALGAGYAESIDALWPALAPDAGVCAVAGMAAVVGATSAAVVTAIVMVLEITHGYAALLPIILTVAIAYLVRLWLTPESIYTLKLARRGRTVPHGLQAAVSEPLDAEHVMSRDFEVLEADEAGGRLPVAPGDQRYTVVVEQGRIAGVALAPGDRIDRDVRVVAPGTRWPELMRTVKSHGCERLIVATDDRPDAIVGVITAREIARAAREKADLMD
jgi:CIC family chloride channel protein